MIKMAGGMLSLNPLINPAGRSSMAISIILIQTVMLLPVGKRLTVNGIILNREPGMIWNAHCIYPTKMGRSILESFGISEIVLNLFGKVTNCPG